MSAVTIQYGVVTISTKNRSARVDLSATAEMIYSQRSDDIADTEILALAAGCVDLERQVNELRAELKAAHAGEIGRNHAEEMQGARKAIANLRESVESFLGEYNLGNGPDTIDLEEKANEAMQWLICDSNASAKRERVLAGEK
jgi:hypothetical protein